MALVDFSLVSPAGDELPLATSADRGGAYGLLLGTSGLGLAPRDVRLATSAAADGARVRAVRIAARDATLNVLVWGVDEAERAANLDRLARAVRTVRGLPAPKLVGRYATGEVYELPFVYTGGAEDLIRISGSGALEVPLNVLFPDPFWTAVDALTFTFEGPADGIGLLPDLAALKIAGSSSSGSQIVTNPGDVESAPVWRIVGPAASVTAELDGRSWQIGPVAEDETVVIDTRTNAVELLDGTNVYDRMGDRPKLFRIPAGPSTVSAAITSATPATSVSCFYRPRKEVIL